MHNKALKQGRADARRLAWRYAKKNMLIPSEVAKEFLDRYKLLMKLMNKGEEPRGTKEYATLRALIYEKMDDVDDLFSESIGFELIQSLREAVFGKFAYLKKYKNGYALYSFGSEKYYLCKALTSSLDEFIEPYSIIETAIVPFKGYIICDGLVLKHGVHIGKNMAKNFRDGYWAATRDSTIAKGK